MRTNLMKAGCIFIVLAAAAGIGRGVLGGSLEPPGPPAPTMKTLTEVEPRIPIHASDLPLTITKPGSYYLAENIVTSGGGVTIAADNVALDLEGFSLSGGSGDAVGLSGTRKGLTIRNGTISGWSGSAIALVAANVLVEGMRAEGNGGEGIRVGDDSTVVDSQAHTTVFTGIRAGNGARIDRCTVTSSQTTISDGIRVGWYSTVTGSVVRGNGGNGIVGGDSCTVRDSVALDNDRTGILLGDGATVNGSTSALNFLEGIRTGSGAHVIGCTAYSNRTTGILIVGDSYVVGNTSRNNGSTDTFGAGIEATTLKNRIEGNNVTGNQTGILAGAGNFVFKNTAGGNVTNYDVGPDAGPIGSPATATSPWANIAY